jgi:hypothetical protein
LSKHVAKLHLPSDSSQFPSLCGPIRLRASFLATSAER